MFGQSETAPSSEEDSDAGSMESEDNEQRVESTPLAREVDDMDFQTPLGSERDKTPPIQGDKENLPPTHPDLPQCLGETPSQAEEESLPKSLAAAKKEARNKDSKRNIVNLASPSPKGKSKVGKKLK